MTPYYAARADANQPEIVKGLRARGMTVALLHQVGKGVPDLVVGHRGRNYLLEVKDPNSARHKRDSRAAPDKQSETKRGQLAWHAAWRGQVAIVETVEQALAVIEGDTA